MPQIFVIRKPGSRCLLTDREMIMLGRRLIPVVEKGFGIEGHNDVAFDDVVPENTINEADFQIEIRYTAGTDEYGWGKPFKPSVRRQEKVADLVEAEFRAFLKNRKVSDRTLSVWCKPFVGGYFKMYGKKKKKEK